MKYIALFFLVILLTSGTTVPEDDFALLPADVDVLFWSSDRKLTWTDFRGEPRARGITGAATHTRIKATPKVVNSRTGRVEVRVHALFECRKSWALEEAKKSDYLLNHEQRHFDIAEIYARKLRRALGRQRITTRNYSKVKREVIDRLFREYIRYDESYDNETIHGVARKAQMEWDREIDSQLNDL